MGARKSTKGLKPITPIAPFVCACRLKITSRYALKEHRRVCVASDRDRRAEPWLNR